MNPNLEKIERLLDEAQQLPPGQWSAYLDAAGAGDETVRREVEALLAADAAAGDFLSSNPKAELPTGTSARSGTLLEGPGAVIGRYKLLEQIGEGGFGVVYMAEQLEPVKRQVALKIIKPGMDSRQVIGRFEAERQALALMDHPNIAKIFDAGMVGETDSALPASPSAPSLGRPYFVMELIKGIPLTKFCEEHEFGLEARLKVFIQICAAVQHAHQKGIIHRDIKPSNILVTLHGDQPVPKVIDFGIAKATQQPLTDKTAFTQFQQFLGTPAYMSPEQATLSGLDVDTRSDIYSLGVLLYELLTGSPPFDSKELLSAGLDEMRRIIREQEPERPSTRIRKLTGSPRAHACSQPAPSPFGSGREGKANRTKACDEGVERRSRGRVRSPISSDLDLIVMKALEKDRARRYETANGLAADLRRYLDHEPVTAVAPTLLYQTRKYYERHRVTVHAGVAFAGLLALATVVSVGQAFRANRNAAAASASEDRARKSEATAQRAERETRARLYAADMVAVQQALRQGNLGLAREILLQHIPQTGEPDFRGFEWRYYWQQARGDQLHTFRGHSNLVQCVTFSPDGRLLASGDWDGKVILWEVAEHRMASSFAPDDGKILSLAFDSSGSLLAVGSETALSLWRLGSAGQPELVKKRRADRVRAAFIPGTTRLVMTEGMDADGNNPMGSGMIWDYDRNVIVHVLDRCGGNLALPADGKTLFTGAQDDFIHAWDLASGTRSLAAPFVGPMIRLACSADGRWLISSSGELTSVAELRSGVTLKPVRELIRHERNVTIWGAAFSPDGQFAATCDSDQQIELWNLGLDAPPVVLRGHGNEVRDVCFSPDGEQLASGSKDQTVCLWNPRQRRDSNLIPGYANWVLGNYFARSPDGAWLAVNSDHDSVELWDVASRRLAQKFTNVQGVLGFISGGKKLLLLGTDQQLQTRAVDTLELESVTPLASGLAGFSNMLLSPDGSRLLAQAGNGHEWMVWDTKTGALVDRTELNDGLAQVIRFFPDGQHLATAHQTTVLIWRLQPFKLVRRIKAAHQGEVSALAISPDGEFLMTGGYDNVAKVWSAVTGSELMKLEGHRRVVRSGSFSPAGTTLATASNDGTVRFWNLSTGRAVGHWVGTHRVPYMAFTADGTCLDIAEDSVGIHLLEAPFPMDEREERVSGARTPGISRLNQSPVVPASAISAKAALPGSPITIVRQPEDHKVAFHGTARFFAQADGGKTPLSYQWFHLGRRIPGATNTACTIPEAWLSDAGSYTVVVTGKTGSARSRTATLTVELPETSSHTVLAYDEFDGTGGRGWIESEPNPSVDGMGQFSHLQGNYAARRFSLKPLTNTVWMALTMKMSAPADDYYFVVPGNTTGARADCQFFSTGFFPTYSSHGMHDAGVYSEIDQLQLQTFLYRFDSQSGQTRYRVWILAGDGRDEDFNRRKPLAEGWIKQQAPGVNSYYRTFSARGQQRLLVDRICLGTSAEAALGIKPGQSSAE